MGLKYKLSAGLLRGGGGVGPLSSKRLLKKSFFLDPFPYAVTFLSLAEFENRRQSCTVSGSRGTRTRRGAKAEKWKSRTVLVKGAVAVFKAPCTSSLETPAGHSVWPLPSTCPWEDEKDIWAPFQAVTSPNSLALPVPCTGLPIVKQSREEAWGEVEQE